MNLSTVAVASPRAAELTRVRDSSTLNVFVLGNARGKCYTCVPQRFSLYRFLNRFTCGTFFRVGTFFGVREVDLAIGRRREYSWFD